MDKVKTMECLNQDSECTLEKMVAKVAPLKSDCDEQLIINLTFGEPVKVNGLKFISSSASKASRPSTVRVFLNERNVLFSNVNNLAPRDEVKLEYQPGEQGEVATAFLPRSRFMACYQFTIFITGNEDEEDVTILDGFDVLGEVATGQGTSDLPCKS